MHRNIWQLQLRNSREHLRIAHAARNIIYDNLAILFVCPADNLRTEGVNRHRNLARHLFRCRESHIYPAPLLCRCDIVGIGA